MHASSWTNSFIHTPPPLLLLPPPLNPLLTHSFTRPLPFAHSLTRPLTHSLTNPPTHSPCVFGREEEEDDEEEVSKEEEDEATVDDPSQCIHDNQRNKETATPGSCKTKQGKTHREQTTSCLLTYS